MTQIKKYSDRVVVKIDRENMDGLQEREIIWNAADGRVVGISRAINKSLKDYLGRI